jgi:chemotaxis protein MotB
MSSGKDAAAEEIVIVRRRGGGEDDHHHGGVWKIAYADFMTAMMAFFLVMWLINAANTETKATVASYFNPIRLTDTAPRKKGVQDSDLKRDLGDKPAAKGNDKKQEHPKPQSQSPAGEGLKPDRAAAKEDRDIASASSLEAGRAFRDPFNPMSAAELLAKQEQKRAADVPKAEPVQSPPERSKEAAEKPAAERLEESLATAAEIIRQDVAAATKLLGNSGGPGVDVRVEGDAVVLSLTDTSTFGMFAIGSAEPNADLVRLLQTIAPALTANGDHIVLRGHTDARPYKADGRNNNWRLAMSRAEAAYAMLLKSGIDERRFERIEAYADRKLKISTDPGAAANRRIEIVLRKDKG